ncbi:MAG: GNAT family N-acetyltransferase [Planctomycetota bacterium]
MSVLLPTDALIIRAMRARATCKESREAGAAPDHMRRFGGAVALRNEWVRRVVAFTADELPMLDEMLAWLGDGGRAARLVIEVPPVDASKAVYAELSRRGLRYTGAQALLAREPARPGLIDEPLPPGLTLDVVEHASQLADFARVFVDGFGLADDAPADREMLLQRIAAEHMHEPARWRVFLARVDGQPAALGTLFIVGDGTGGTGWFANGATLHAFRGRGAHRAVTLARLRAATEAGLELVAVDTHVNSAAQRSLHRAGFHLLAHFAQWGDAD